ncbi:MAG TPA: AEC family transporter [Burkholderiaceae bacterium]|nr:AEC family transporter [Burkholderiaceae bacterium]
MPPIFAVTIPFFALVAMGYAAAHRRLLPESAIPGLNAFVLWFALPAMLFRFGMTTPIGQLLNPTVLVISLVASLAIVGFTLVVTLSPRVAMKDAAFGALVAAFPNTGFMGVPLLTALLGAAAAGPVICALLIDLFVTTSLCIALAQAHDAVGSGGTARAALKRALGGALSNPLPWSIALGAACSVVGFKLGGPLATIVDMLANAASPVALFTIGAVLWRAGQHAHTRTPLALVVPVVAIKLFVHPFAVFALAAAARALGAPLGTFEAGVLVLAAALPSASNVSLLAERYGADNGRVARIILGSTAAAFVTFTLFASLLRAAPMAA